jgi:hypothetical protein
MWALAGDGLATRAIFTVWLRKARDGRLEHAGAAVLAVAGASGRASAMAEATGAFSRSCAALNLVAKAREAARLSWGQGGVIPLSSRGRLLLAGVPHPLRTSVRLFLAARTRTGPQSA